jgi:uncharacterized membrane protein YfcA
VAVSIELVLLAAVFGVLVGVASAMFGIGGGVIMVPFLVLVLGETQHVAEGTSLLVVVPTAIAGVVAHHRRGYVDFKRAGAMAVTGVFGGFVGARFALSVDAETLQKAFGVFILVMALRMFRDGLRKRGERDDV